MDSQVITPVSFWPHPVLFYKQYLKGNIFPIANLNFNVWFPLLNLRWMLQIIFTIYNYRKIFTRSPSSTSMLLDVLGSHIWEPGMKTGQEYVCLVTQIIIIFNWGLDFIIAFRSLQFFTFLWYIVIHVPPLGNMRLMGKSEERPCTVVSVAHKKFIMF